VVDSVADDLLNRVANFGSFHLDLTTDRITNLPTQAVNEALAERNA
jgi:hypothetical protein